MSFKRLDPEDISISAESVVAPLWSSGDGKYLTSFHTSSGQVASNTGNYFYEIYDGVYDSPTPVSVQFAIAYGHKEGKGALPYYPGVNTKTPTSTIYGQYRNLIFGDEEVGFVFGTYESDDIYVMSIDRARYKEKLLPGSFNLKLTNGDKTLHLTDNSADITTVSYVDAGRVYDIISGSHGIPYNNGTGFTAEHGSYGKFLPDVGVVVLNGAALNLNTYEGINIATNPDINGAVNNLDKFYSAIKNGASGSLQSEETISSNYVFVRVRNSEFNYSTNPSNITSSGELRHDVMINTPQAYITTVGLYNDNNDLLGVAKLSRPLLKDFTKEALVRIKLDY